MQSTLQKQQPAFWIKVCLTIIGLLFSLNTAHAQYATGGNSPYKNDVLWLTWGGGTNGTAGVPLGNGSTSSATIQISATQTLTVTCTLSNTSGTSLESYVPGQGGDWSQLDDLYNIDGTGANNKLVNAISNTSGVSSFTITCNADINGQPFELRGLVMADAESINTTGEYVEATATGNWHVVEMVKNPGEGPYYAIKTNNGSSQTLRFGPGPDNDVAAVTFLEFAAPSSTVSMDFEMSAGGTTAIAIGLLSPYSDFGDAPASYGDASHVIRNLTFSDDNIPADGSQHNLNTAGYQSGALVAPNIDYLGSNGPDTEPGTSYSNDAIGDNALRGGAANEEDAWPENYTITVLQEGETLAESVPCTGTGTVAGWIDFDRNGTFDSDERTQAACSGGSADLSWTISNDLSAGQTFVRLRYSTDASALLSPTGIAPDGEVEDQTIEIIAPELSVTKSSNATAGEWSIGQANAQYTLTVANNGQVATGDPSNGIPPEPVTVKEQLPIGIEAGWSGTQNFNGWSCTVSGQNVKCTYDQVIAAGGSTSFNLPVQVTASAEGSTTNYASVGGGRDPSNGGEAPTPGAGCSPGEQCDSTPVTVVNAPNLAPCDDSMYMSQGSGGTITLYKFDTSNNPFQYDPLGSQGTPYYNAVGYNPNDYYLYGIQQSDDHLVRIGDDGQAIDLGAISGLPPSAGSSYFGGEIAPDGSYYVMIYGGNTLYEIDINTQSVANTISLSQSLNAADMAWHNGLLYTVGDSNLYSIDPTSGAVTNIGSVGSG